MGSYFSSLFFTFAPFIFSLLISLFHRASVEGVIRLLLRFPPFALGTLRLAPLPLILLLTPPAHAAQVTLQWDPNTESDLAGYKVYYGTASGNYQFHIDVGKVTTLTVSGLQEGQTYYFAATAYDTSQLESDFSEEVVYTAALACTYAISPSTQSFNASGGAGTVSVTAGAGCAWTTVSNASWLTLTSNSSSAGSGTVNYSASRNTSTSSRTGTLTIAGRTFTVNQEGASCSYSLSPTGQSFSSSGGTGTINVTAPAGCAWSASSQTGWIAILSGSSGNGNGTVSYSVSTNSTSSSRSGSLTVAGQAFTVSQQGVPQYSLTVNRAGTGGGTVNTSPAGTIFNQGTVVTLTATADLGSIFEGWSGGCTGVSPTCSLTLNSNTTVTATFNLKSFTINASAGANGSISPQGTIKISYGASQSFAIAAATGYQVSDVKVDGISVGVVSSYLFGNVTADHTIGASFAPLPPPLEPGSVILALNAGGPDYVGAGGVPYQSDRYFIGGAAQRTDLPIQGTADISLYQTERYGNFSYAIPLANGNYDLTLKFAESTYWSRGQRIFDVFVEGKAVLTNLDIYSAAGTGTALDVTFTVSVVDGVLDLHFISKTGDAKVNALLITTPSNTPKKVPGKIKRYFSTQSRTIRP